MLLHVRAMAKKFYSERNAILKSRARPFAKLHAEPRSRGVPPFQNQNCHGPARRSRVRATQVTRASARELIPCYATYAASLSRTSALFFHLRQCDTNWVARCCGP